MAKLDTISSFIQKCDEIIKSGDKQKAKNLRNEIISVYNSDISNIEKGVQKDWDIVDSKDKTDYIDTVYILKSKLINLKDTIEMEEKQEELELEKLKLQQSILNINNTNQNNNDNTSNATTNIAITLEQTIEQIQKIPDEKLSDEDKNKLVEDVYDLEKLKHTNKNKFWDKYKDVLKFIADKGADAAIAALPLIVQGLTNL